MVAFVRAQLAVLILACGVGACNLAIPTPSSEPPLAVIDPTVEFPPHGDCQQCAEDFSTTQTIATFDSKTPIAQLKWLPDDSALALLTTGYRSGPTQITLLYPPNWAPQVVYSSQEAMGEGGFDISPDGTRFLLGNEVINRITGLAILIFKNDEKPYAFSPDGKWLVGAHFAKEGPADRFFIWDAATGVEHADLGLVPSDERLFVFHPTDGSIGIHDVNDDWTRWDLTSGKFLGPDDKRLPSGSSVIPFLPYSPNDQWLSVVELAEDNSVTIKLIEVATGELHTQLQNRDTTLELDGAIWSANSRTIGFLSSPYSDMGVQFWDTDTGQFIRSLKLRYMQSPVLSPDGNYLLWVSYNTVRYLKIRGD